MITPTDFEVRERLVYMDNAATTVIDQTVVDAMAPYLEERYGNPETVYGLGEESRVAVEKARQQVADALGCPPANVYFTSGGTESNNWAIKGYNMTRGGTNVASEVEHASVLESIKWLSKCFSDHYSHVIVGVDSVGRIKMDELEETLSGGKVGLLSVQYGNNEVGTLQPVVEIAALCKKHSVVFHCDACQAFGKVDFDVEDLGVDMLSISSHKIHGPMGAGALYVKPGLDLEPLLHGGGQESGLRSGTLAVPAIVGFGEAASLARLSIGTGMKTVRRMVDSIAEDLVAMKLKRNGDPVDRLPHILSVTLPDMPGATAVGELAKLGVCVSMGSACRSKKRSSHVLSAMGMGYSENNRTIRISLGVNTTRDEQMLLVHALQKILKKPGFDYL